MIRGFEGIGKTHHEFHLDWKLLLLLGFLFSFRAVAQPVLNVNRMEVNWPTIELYFVVDCDGITNYNLTRDNIRLFEDSLEIKDYTLWCPPQDMRCAVSMALVLDAGIGVKGEGNEEAKAAAHAIVNEMDGIEDEATVVAFNNAVTVVQQMTTIRSMLHSAVDLLPVSGSSAVWDGIYTGIEELINNGVNQCRAVIVMTDGLDGASRRTMQDVIALANRNRIRVFTLGMGAIIHTDSLQRIADSTGGAYYEQPDQEEIKEIYKEISRVIFNEKECVIWYTGCADGSMRTVELIVGCCGGSDSKETTYQAPLDSTSFSDLRMDIGEVDCGVGQDVTVPIYLITPFYREVFYPMNFTLRYDDACMQFTGVSTPPHSILSGVPITVTPVSGGVHIRSAEAVQSHGQAVVMEFTFRAGEPVDTAHCRIEIVNAAFDQGCWTPVIEDGQVSIIPVVSSVATERLPAHKLDVYPDPNHGSITLTMPLQGSRKIVIGVYDLLGRRVMDIPGFEANGRLTRHMDLRSLPDGMYLIQVNTGTNIHVKTILKR